MFFKRKENDLCVKKATLIGHESLGKQSQGIFERTVCLRYLLFLPRDYERNPDTKWPLILFLHGAGELGNKLELVKKHGIPKIVERRPDFPFVVLSPQCPDETTWWDHHRTLKLLLDEIVAKYAIGRHRIYLTGLSMGGYGTWSLAMTYPKLFAAIAPICGGGFPEFACLLKDVPIWAFHGAEDRVVKLEASQRIVDALRACGGDVRFTVYPGAGHDPWTRTYNNPKLYKWFESG